jgi:hypothetical protein
MGPFTSIMDSKLVRRMHAKAHSRENTTFHRVWNMIFSLGRVELLFSFVIDHAGPLSVPTNSSFINNSGHWTRDRSSLFLLLTAGDESEYIYSVSCPLLTELRCEYNAAGYFCKEYNTTEYFCSGWFRNRPS